MSQSWRYLSSRGWRPVCPRNLLHQSVRLSGYSCGMVMVAAFLITSVCLSGNEISEPFFQTNRNPLVSIFGLPPAETAQLIPLRGQSFSLVVDAANSFSRHNAGNEFVLLDGETTRTTFVWRAKWTEQLEVGLDVPWVHHGGGHLDPLISTWHRFLGISTGDRGAVPEGRFHFAYYRDGDAEVDTYQAVNGIGDVRLVAGWQLFSRNGRWLALRTGLKLPTGDSERLLGSGSTDGNVGIHFRDTLRLSSCPLAYEVAGGILATGDGDIDSAHRRNRAFYGSSHFAVHVVDWLAFKIQMDGHGPLYRSRLRELGKGSAQLTLGASIAFRDRWVASLAAAEEIIVDAAPDVVVFFSIRYRLRKER